MNLSEGCLQQLRNAGLHVSDPYPDDHVAYPGGVSVGKPGTVPGNGQAGYRVYLGLSDVYFDGPCVVLYVRRFLWRTRWIVVADANNMGAAMRPWFVDRWRSEAEAVRDIVDFYFGDAGRMNACTDAALRESRWWDVRHWFD